MIANEARSAELAIIISYPTSASGIIVLLKTPSYTTILQLYHYLTKNCIISERILRSDEGLTLETSAVIISVRRSIYIINSVDKTKNVRVLLPHRVGGTVDSWFVRSTPDPVVRVRVRVLAGEIVLCSWARHFTLMVLLSTKMYKWEPANLMLGVTL